MSIRLIVLLLAVAGQVGFFAISHDWRPERRVLPPLPNDWVAGALALGDDQFLFRTWTHQLETAGDTGGRVTPLRTYDYAQVRAWLERLDTLDRVSNHPVSLASVHFGFTDIPDQAAELVTYIRSHVAGQGETKWFWLTRAIYLAREKVEDPYLVLQVARELDAVGDEADSWTWFFLPTALRNVGDYQGAADAMQRRLERSGDRMSVGEQNFSYSFISEMQQLQR